MKVPFSPPYIDQDIKTEVEEVLTSGWITTGPKVRAFEKLTVEFCGAQAALAVNSATSGLMLSLHWLGIKEGDEVIIPAYTYCATALVVMHAGGKPVMVDVGDDFNIDVAKIISAITPRTKAIITVDIGGWPCDYQAIADIVNDPVIKANFNPASEVQRRLGRIMMLSDAAHSLGAEYHRKKIGSLADITVFSFHAVKNVTTAEGGMICLNMPEPFDNKTIYQTLRVWSLNGQTKDAYTKTVGNSWRYDVVYPGFKMNMPDVLAAIGFAQMKMYGQLIGKRKQVFACYISKFKKYDWAVLPKCFENCRESSYHLFLLRIKDITEEQRDKVIDYVMQKGISVNVHFVPLPLLTVFKERGYTIENYPESLKHYQGEISLPVYPQLTSEQISYVTEMLAEAVNNILYER